MRLARSLWYLSYTCDTHESNSPSIATTARSLKNGRSFSAFFFLVRNRRERFAVETRVAQRTRPAPRAPRPDDFLGSVFDVLVLDIFHSTGRFMIFALVPRSGPSILVSPSLRLGIP